VVTGKQPAVGISLNTIRCQQRLQRCKSQMTAPNAKSGRTKPTNGCPVVIFQHGFRQDRSNVLALADPLSFVGFVVVAIDLPLHGITNKNSPFYTAGMERTFDLDVVNNTTLAPIPDGIIDPSGTHFLNLKNLLAIRDNSRQGEHDIRQLTAILPLVDLNGDQKPDIDAGRIHFVGHSLGGILGGTFLAIEDAVTSATLAMAGGGIAKVADASPAYSPLIVAGLAAAGINKGTSEYERFITAFQTVIDSGDPVNYGAQAASLHPIHLIEVVGGAGSLPDQVVPNSVVNAPLSGTEPLAKIMGLQSVNRTVTDNKGVRAIVRFTQGDHSSILSPVAAVGATAEMQGQLIKFLQTKGEELEIIYQPVVK
jgi:pimeloyl-ACP methyl ester carboxylesterase